MCTFHIYILCKKSIEKEIPRRKMTSFWLTLCRNWVYFFSKILKLVSYTFKLWQYYVNGRFTINMIVGSCINYQRTQGFLPCNIRKILPPIVLFHVLGLMLYHNLNSYILLFSFAFCRSDNQRNRRGQTMMDFHRMHQRRNFSLSLFSLVMVLHFFSKGKYTQFDRYWIITRYEKRFLKKFNLWRGLVGKSILLLNEYLHSSCNVYPLQDHIMVTQSY